MREADSMASSSIESSIPSVILSEFLTSMSVAYPFVIAIMFSILLLVPYALKAEFFSDFSDVCKTYLVI
jgi:hypothetical protein